MVGSARARLPEAAHTWFWPPASGAPRDGGEIPGDGAAH